MFELVFTRLNIQVSFVLDEVFFGILICFNLVLILGRWSDAF